MFLSRTFPKYFPSQQPRFWFLASQALGKYGTNSQFQDSGLIRGYCISRPTTKQA